MARSRKSRTVDAGEGFATPPPERGQHDELEVISLDPRDRSARRVQVKAPDRLAKYLALRSIELVQHDAGRWLRDDWVLARKSPSCTVNLLSSGGGRRDLTGTQVDADRRVRRALGGRRQRWAKMLVAVCCFDEAAGSTQQLRVALSWLAFHYQLVTRRELGRLLRIRRSGSNDSGTLNDLRTTQRHQANEEADMAKSKGKGKGKGGC